MRGSDVNVRVGGYRRTQKPQKEQRKRTLRNYILYQVKCVHIFLFIYLFFFFECRSTEYC